MSTVEKSDKLVETWFYYILKEENDPVAFVITIKMTVIER